MTKKVIANSLIIIGFVWILVVCLDIFSAPHHLLWILHSQNLPEKDMIPRSEVVVQMRELELVIQDRYQPLVIPAFLMLVGGIANGVVRKNRTEQPPAH